LWHGHHNSLCNMCQNGPKACAKLDFANYR
jgi:hypothetical protein